MLPRLAVLVPAILAALLGCARQPAPQAASNAADTTLARQFVEEAEQFAWRGRYDSAFVYFDRARRHHEAAQAWPGALHASAKMGDCARELGKYEQARQLLDEALETGRQRLGTSHPALAEVYDHLAQLYADKEEHRRAIEVLEQGLALRRTAYGEQHAEVAENYRRLGVAHLALFECEPAEIYYDNALRIALSIHGEQSKEVAEIYSGIGYLKVENTMDFAGGIAEVQKALDIDQSIHGEGSIDEANHLDWLAHFYWVSKDHERAVEPYEKALNIRLAVFGEYHPDVAESLNRVASFYVSTGSYERAEPYYNRALRIYRAIYDEQHPQVAVVYTNFGYLYQQMRDYERSIEMLQNALRINRSIHGDIHSVTAHALNNLGGVHFANKNYVEAHACWGESLRIFLALYDETHPLVANAYATMGTVTNRLGNPVQALEYYQKALDLMRDNFGFRDYLLGGRYNGVAATYETMSEWDKALHFHNRSLYHRIAAFGNHHPLVAAGYTNIADLHLKTGRFDLALANYEQSLKANIPPTDSSALFGPTSSTINVLSEPDWLEALWGRARSLSARAGIHNVADLRTSVDAFSEATRFLDETRKSISAEGSRMNWAETAAPQLASAVETAMRLHVATGDDSLKKTAFYFAQKSKASVLLGAFSEARARQFAGIPDSLLAQERKLVSDVTAAEQRLLNASPDTDPAAERSRLEREVFALKRSRDSLIAHLEHAFPDYYNLKYNAAVATPEMVQAQVLDDSTALVEYVVGDERLFVFTLTASTFDVTTVPKDSLLESHVTELRRGIVEQDYEAYTRHAHALYRQLLEPVADQLRVPNLIVVPDGVLNYVPFEALLTQNPTTSIRDYRRLPYLIERHAVSYAYSSTLLLETRHRQRPRPERDYLAFAPVFEGGVPAGSRGAALLKANGALDSTRAAAGYLPSTREEVTGILELFQDQYNFLERFFTRRAQIYLDDEAREANLREAGLDQYRYVHFATHGFASETSPEHAGLVLYPEADTDDPETDGVLRLREVYTLRLNADLVVLSACETGLGRLARGEGMLSLTRGFLYAGARNVLVSLWKADDERTRALMLRFYEDMLATKERPSALRAAKLGLIRGDPRYARPYYWASFVLIGT